MLEKLRNDIGSLLWDLRSKELTIEEERAVAEVRKDFSFWEGYNNSDDILFILYRYKEYRKNLFRIFVSR